MKTFLYLFIFLLSFQVSAQEADMNLFGKNYTFIRFDWRAKNQYPVIFTTVVESDSLTVDVHDLESFAKSIYNGHPFVLFLGTPLYKAYQKLFDTKNLSKEYNNSLWNSADLFISIFYDNMKQLQTEEKIKLKTDGYVYVSYFDVTGFFLKLDKETDWVNCSIGIQDPSWVNEMIMPISIVNYQKTNSFRIIEQSSDSH